MPEGTTPREPPAAECAYQCEVCNNAVFSTFKACADHEEECAKKHGKGGKEEDVSLQTEEQKVSPTKKKEEKDKVEDAKTGGEGTEV